MTPTDLFSLPRRLAWALLAFIVGALPSGLLAQPTSYEFILPSPLGYEINDIWNFGNGRLVGTGHCGILFTSLDDGATWTPQTLNSGDILFEIEMVNAQRGAIVAQSGIYLTEDGGSTWTHDSQSFGDARQLDWIDDTTLVVGGGNALLRRSTDAGQSWTDIAPFAGGATIQDISFRNSQEGVILYRQANVYSYTTDGGTTWTDGFLSGNLSLLRSTPNGTFHLFNSDFDYWRSTDGGVSWVPAASQSNFPMGVVDAVFPTDDLGIAFTEAPPFIKYTTDGGLSWTSSSGAPVPLFGFYTHGQLSFDASGNGFLIADHAVYTTADSGQVFQTQLEEQSLSIFSQIRDIQIISATEYFAAANNGNLLHSTDAGQSWQTIGPDGESAVSVYFFDSNTGLMGSFSTAGFVRTTDGGSTWSLVNSTPTAAFDLNVVAIDFADNKQWGLAIADRELIQTNDGGLNWSQQVQVAPGKRFYDVEVVSSSAAFALSDDLVWQTTNAGATWTNLDPAPMGAPGNYSAIAIPSPDTIYITRDDFGLVYSYDGGLSWGTSVRPNTYSDIYFLNGQAGYLLEFSGNGNMISATTDGANTWLEVETGLCFLRWSMDFWENDFGLIGGDEGQIVKLDNAGFVNVTEGMFPVNEAWFGLDNGVARVEFSERLPFDAQFQLIDVQGRTIASREIRRGVLRAELPIEQPLRGLYILRVTGDGQQWSQKVRAGR